MTVHFFMIVTMFITEDILEDVDEISIPETLIQRLQEEK